jgi:hypothetical protein
MVRGLPDLMYHQDHDISHICEISFLPHHVFLRRYYAHLLGYSVATGEDLYVNGSGPPLCVLRFGNETCDVSKPVPTTPALVVGRILPRPDPKEVDTLAFQRSRFSSRPLRQTPGLREGAFFITEHGHEHALAWKTTCGLVEPDFPEARSIGAIAALTEALTADNGHAASISDMMDPNQTVLLHVNTRQLGHEQAPAQLLRLLDSLPIQAHYMPMTNLLALSMTTVDMALIQATLDSLNDAFAPNLGPVNPSVASTYPVFLFASHAGEVRYMNAHPKAFLPENTTTPQPSEVVHEFPKAAAPGKWYRLQGLPTSQRIQPLLEQLEQCNFHADAIKSRQWFQNPCGKGFVLALLQPAEAAAPTTNTFALGQATISIEQDLPQGMVAVTPFQKAPPQAHLQAIRATITKPTLKHAYGVWNHTTTTKRRRKAPKNGPASVRVDSPPAGQSPHPVARPAPFNAAQMAQGVQLQAMYQQHKEQDQQLASRLPASQHQEPVPATGAATEPAKASSSSAAVPAPDQDRLPPVPVAKPATAPPAVPAIAPAALPASLPTAPPAEPLALVTLPTPAKEAERTSLQQNHPQAALANVAAAGRQDGDADAQPPHNATASLCHTTWTQVGPVDNGYMHTDTLQTTTPLGTKRPPSTSVEPPVPNEMTDSDSQQHAGTKKQKPSTALAEGDNTTTTSS